MPETSHNPPPCLQEELVEEAARIVKEMRISPCPDVLTRFASEVSAPDPDLRKLSALIGSDVALSASLLKTVNSAIYNLPAKATSVREALSILGLRASSNLISGLLLLRAFPAASGALMERFWSETSSLAQSAVELAARVRGVSPDEAHTFMLFRDCGMAAMIAQFPNYGQIVDAYTRTASAQVNALEMSRYRYHHGRVGYALTRSWQLPEPFCLSILHHHDLDQPESGIALLDGANYRLIAFGLLADQVFALRHGKGLRPDWLAQERHVLATLQVLPEEIIAYLHADDAEAAVPEDALA